MSSFEENIEDPLSGSDRSLYSRVMKWGGFVLGAIFLHLLFIGLVVELSIIIPGTHTETSESSKDNQVDVSVVRKEPEPEPEPEKPEETKKDETKKETTVPEPTDQKKEPRRARKAKESQTKPSADQKPALPEKQKEKKTKTESNKEEADPVDLEGLTMESTSASSDGPKIKTGKGIEVGRMNQKAVDTSNKKRRRREGGQPDGSERGLSAAGAKKQKCKSIKPKPVDKYRVPESDYPTEARRRGLSGKVTAVLTVDKSGRVQKINLIQKAGHGFDELAKDAFKKWRFEPARKNCEPVEAQIRVVHQFELSR